ncbi:MAG: response regulator [Deltaproteobacteria bacterium]|nr:response regulator [Candidatus Anaeroferrophillacea bacterium]
MTQPYRILVVDDEESIRLLYEEELADEGYEVQSAASAEEALAAIPVFKPHLVTMDIKMPGMSGVDALIRIKEIDRSIPVILCTAYGEYKQDFSTWASDDYVVKSSSLDELKQHIQRLLNEKPAAE